MKKPEPSDLLIAAATAVILILISFLAGKALDLLNKRAALTGIGIFLIIVLGIVALVIVVQRASQQQDLEVLSTSHRHEVETLAASHREEISSLIERLRGIIPPPTFKWLLSDPDIARIEGEVSGTDIWIVSPDLHFDVIEGSFQELTKKNFARGITYTYIVPKTHRMRGRVATLRHVYADYLSQVKVRQVPEDSFRLLAVASIDVYDPKGERARVFLQLPVDQRGYWIELSRDDADSFIGRFMEIAEDESLT